MNIQTFKTDLVTVGCSMVEFIDSHIPKLEERSILVVTSKVVSLCEGRVVAKKDVNSKKELIRKEADAYFQGSTHQDIQFTLKNNLLIPSAGIDESNSGGDYILYPQDVQKSAALIWDYLRQKQEIEHLGVVITDSHSTFLRRGTIGIGLGWCGFKALDDYRGQLDCFGYPLRVTQSNHLDGLAAAAVFCMGEGCEQTPLALITQVPKIVFQLHPPTNQEVADLFLSFNEDIYAPLLKSKDWVFKKRE